MAIGAQAQLLKGKVTADNEALKGASILVDGVAKAQSDEAGLFSLTVQKIPFRLSIRHMSYVPLDTMISSLPKAPLLLRMQLAIAQLEAVKISTGY
ncbi:MAG: hypothetical protein DI539_29620, partial [Flavobacterium psychrophilum]